jgi:TonB family protein
VTSDDYYERAIKHYDTNTELSESERYDDCFFGALNQALRIDPGNADALALRGLGYLKEGNVDQAMADLNEAIEIAPDNFRAYQYRSEAHITVKEYEKAIQDTTKSIEVAPPNYPYFHTLYSNRASLYTQTGDHENAVKDYTEAINLKPAYWFNYSYRAKAYRELGKNDLAEADEKTVEMIMAEEGQLEDQIKRKLESQNAQEEPDKNSEDPINEVLELPRPKYPAVARMIEASGQVRVQIEVDTNGNVKSAEAVSGSPFLRPAAAEAARKAKFRPRRATGTFELIYTFEPELGEANVELRRQRSK